MSELLEVKDLVQVFGTKRPVYAVDGVSFEIPKEPTILNLIGESGSGKSTIARIILGLQKPTAGQVLYDGRDVLTKDAEWQQQFRRQVQVIFQNPYSVYNPFYKVARVFDVVNRKLGLARNKTEARARIEDSLRAVDLRPEEVLDKYPHQLSGGQRQRIMLARVHLIRPRMIIADEPVSMIDAAARASFLNILLKFRDRYGISTLFITHDLSTAQYLGGEIIVLYRGRVTERGKTGPITAEPMHPYPKLLMDSIPVPDPSHRWTEMLPISLDADAAQLPGRDHCLYVSRCPFAMAECRQSRPPLYEVTAPKSGEARQVACFLYQPSHQMPSSQVLVTEPQHATAEN